MPPCEDSITWDIKAEVISHDLTEKAGKGLATVQAILDHSDIATAGIYVQDDEAARIQALRDSCCG